MDEGNQAHLDSEAALENIKVQQVDIKKEKNMEPIMPSVESTKNLIEEQEAPLPKLKVSKTPIEMPKT